MRNVRQKISVMPSGNKFMFNVYLSTVDMKDVGLGHFTEIEARGIDCSEVIKDFHIPFFMEKTKVDPMSPNVYDIIRDMEVRAQEAFWRLIEDPMKDFTNPLNPPIPAATKEAPKSKFKAFLQRIFG